MTNPDLTTPPEKLFAKWEDDILNERENVDVVLDCAWKNGFSAGADQELEACCEWVNTWCTPRYLRDPSKWGGPPVSADVLRTARRRKPPSLKEQALAALNVIEDEMLGPTNEEKLIRRALEALDD